MDGLISVDFRAGMKTISLNRLKKYFSVGKYKKLGIY